MEKKKYILPCVDVVQMTMPHLMDSSMNVLPPQPAPRRRTPVF